MMGLGRVWMLRISCFVVLVVVVVVIGFLFHFLFLFSLILFLFSLILFSVILYNIPIYIVIPACTVWVSIPIYTCDEVRTDLVLTCVVCATDRTSASSASSPDLLNPRRPEWSLAWPSLGGDLYTVYSCEARSVRGCSIAGRARLLRAVSDRGGRTLGCMTARLILLGIAVLLGSRIGPMINGCERRTVIRFTPLKRIVIALTIIISLVPLATLLQQTSC